MEFAEIEMKIRALLETELGVENQSLGRDSGLVTTGLVDSAGLVRLAALLETETGILIPDRDIHAENFDTLARIEAYLRGKLAG